MSNPLLPFFMMQQPNVSAIADAVVVPQTGPTLADLFTRFEAEHLADKARSTVENHRSFFVHVLEDLGPLPLAALTPDALREWKLRLSARCKPSTVHRYMLRLSGTLNYAVERSWLPSNPLSHVRKPTPGRGRVRFLTPEERTRLLDACKGSQNPYLYPLVLVSLSTGGRKEEVRTLRWSEVDLDAGQLTFLHTKTGKPRTVPLVGEALAVLHALAQTRRPSISWVFPRWNGRQPIALQSPWETARAKAGLTDVRLHDLRHTFASYMCMSGATLREIADVLGHANIQQTMIYAHLAPSHTRGVVERMAEQFLTNPDQEVPHGD